MTILDILLAFLAAIVVILVAGLLVSWQNNQEDISKKLGDEVTNSIGEAVINYISLTGSSPTKETIESLESDVQKLNDSLRYSVIENSYREKRRKNKNVKRKKNFAND